MTNGRSLILNADCRRIPLPDQSVHCVVTSPPYWGLREYGVEGQIGLEHTVSDYVSEVLGVFREVRRVLRADGTVWLNLGDSYNAYNGNSGPGSNLDHPDARRNVGKPKLQTGHGLSEKSLKPKDLIGIPWRVALALQDDGWFLRSEIIWHKRSPMPESVRDRPTRSHEHIFLLSKSPRYFYDAEAVKEKCSGTARPRGNGISPKVIEGRDNLIKANGQFLSKIAGTVETRHKRSVWTLSSEPYKGSHFATFPTKLVIPCIKAGTSRKGCCPSCGSPWARIVKKHRVATRPGIETKVKTPSGWQTGEGSHDGIEGRYRPAEEVGNRDPRRHVTSTRTVGWKPSCDCPPADPVPCVVFDPFGGAGTTALVAEALGRIGIVTELNPDYCRQARSRIDRPHKRVVVRRETESMPLFPSEAP